MKATKVCAVCGRVLDRWTDGDGNNERWEHSTQDLKQFDHPAVPVGKHEIKPNYRCDFCNLDVSTHTVPASSFTVMITPEQHSVSEGNWSACPTCVELVCSGSWDELVERALTTSPAMRGMANSSETKAVLRVYLGLMYGVLCEHMLGEPFPGWQTHSDPSEGR